MEHNTSLEMEWIPKSKNEKADFISRIVESDDWSVCEDIFEFCDKNGVLIRLTGLLHSIMQSYLDLTLGTGLLDLRV